MTAKLPAIAAIVVILLGGCALAPAAAPTPADAPAAASTQTPIPEPTGTPLPTQTFTPTPVPVSVENAIRQKSLTELEVYGKGRIIHELFSPDGSRFVVLVSRGLYVFDTRTWAQVTFLPWSPGTHVYAIAQSPDGGLFAAGDSAGKVTFWDTNSWEQKYVLPAYDGPITSVDIAPDNVSCVTIGAEKEIATWNIPEGKKIESQVRTKRAGPVHYSIDGTWIMVSEETSYRDLTIWNAADLSFQRRLPQLGRKSPDQAVSPDADIVASYQHGYLYIHDFRSEKEIELKKLFGFFENITMLFLDSSNLLLMERSSDSYYLVDLGTSQMKPVSFGELTRMRGKNPELQNITREYEINALGFMPQSQDFGKIVAPAQDGSALVLSNGMFDLKEKVRKETEALDEYDWSNAVVLLDGKIGLPFVDSRGLSEDRKKGKLKIVSIDPKTNDVVSRQFIPFDLSDAVQDIALSPDGSQVAAGLFDGKAAVWDTKTGEQLSAFRAHTRMNGPFGMYSAFSDIRFNGDGSYFATSGSDETIKIWSAGDFSETRSLRGTLPTFSADGKFLAYAATDNRIHVVSLFDDAAEVTLDGHAGERLTSLMFSPDGTLLFSAGFDQQVKVWSIADQSLLMELPQFDVPSSLAMSADGTRLFISTYDGVIGVWGAMDE